MPDHRDGRRTKFQQVRDAVDANHVAAGRVDPPLRTPEARVHAVVMHLFLGWAKFEDRVAVSSIAERCGWWDGESTPKGEKRPRPERHVRRRVGNALNALAEHGLIGYFPARGAAGKDGHNLSRITLPKPKNGTVSTGPKEWGLLQARNGASYRRVMGPSLLAPTEGTEGASRGNARTTNPETSVDVALRVERLAALTPRNADADTTAALRALELIDAFGIADDEIDAALDEYETDEEAFPYPIDLVLGVLADQLDALTSHPGYRVLADEGVGLAIVDRARGHWLDNAPAAHTISRHLETHAGPNEDLLEEIARTIHDGPRLADPWRAMKTARQLFDLAGIPLPQLDRSTPAHTRSTP